MVARGRKYQQAMLDQLKNPHTKFRLYNIIHPLDPIAYRIEPLFHPAYSNHAPEPIFPCYNRFYDRIGFPDPRTSQLEYYYCATELAMNARRVFKVMEREVKVQERLKRRLDFYVLPLLEEMGHWNTFSNHSCYWFRTSVIHFIKNQIYYSRFFWNAIRNEIIMKFLKNYFKKRK